MHISIKKAVAVSAFVALAVLFPAKAEAEQLDLLDKQNTSQTKLIAVIEPREVPKEKPKEYKVVKGDTLSKIAKRNSTTWLRLWQRNKQLKHPDNIKPNDKLIIPNAKEKLAERKLPEAPRANISPERSEGLQRPQNPSKAPLRASRGYSSAGNTYSVGYCTWYVKNMRPDLPNNLGNADTWFGRAAAQGLAVGYSPRVGAVAATKAYMHVAYVTAVSGNTVTVSEMNYNGWNVVSSRTAPASEFTYIY